MPDDPDTPRREPRIAVGASWCCLIVSFILSAITWVALGRISGYGNLSYLMPFVVDAYVVGSIVTWLQPVSARVARFAYWNMYGAAAIGVISQAVYHCASVYARTNSAWQAMLALIVGSIPPLFAFLGVHLRGLARRELNDRQNTTEAKPQPPPIPPVSTTPALPAPPQSNPPDPPAQNLALNTVTPPRPQPALPVRASVPQRAMRPAVTDREGSINSRHRKVTPDVEARIRGLWDQGLTLQEVMKRSGYKRSTCMRIKTAKDEVERENRERVAS